MNTECRDIADHNFKHFKKNKKDPGELPVYKCKKCGMTWEEMEEIREAQLQLDGSDTSKQLEVEAKTAKDMEAFFRSLLGFRD